MEYTEEEYYKFLENYDASGDYKDLPEIEDYDILEYLESDVEF